MLGIDVNPAKAELTEVQSLDVVAVVDARKAADAYAQLGEPAAEADRPPASCPLICHFRIPDGSMHWRRSDCGMCLFT
jgi:hypothetical protein